MKQIQEDLWQSTRSVLGILNTHAYFLSKPDGNVLFYNTDNSNDLQKIAALGGVEYQLLTHRDESGPSLGRIKAMFDSKLCCSELEVPIISKNASVDIVFEDGDIHLGDIEIIHTPGHTNGSICFFYKSPHGKSYLFSGDTIFQWNAEWGTLVLPNAGGSADLLAESLLKLRNLSPDIVMSSGFVGEVSLVEFTGDEWTKVIDDTVSKLRTRA